MHTQALNNRLRRKLPELFGIDVRSLALMRVATALILLGDLAARSFDLTAFYGSRSVLPPGPATNHPFAFSLHVLNGSAAFETALFLVAAAFALLLLVGWKTRLATIVSWVLLVSVLNANPLIHGGGDMTLKLVLFWAMFLPWGNAYSVDHALGSEADAPARGTRVATIWTAAFLLQIGMIYPFAAAMKSAPSWVSDGTAVYYTLHLTHLVTPVGAWLLHFPVPVLMFVSFGIVWMQRFVFLVLFSPLYTRTLRTFAVLVLMAMHLAFAVTLHVGIFSWICIAALTAFIHPDIWDAAMRGLRKFSGGSVRIYYDGDCGFCKRSVQLIREFFLFPETVLMPAQSLPPVWEDMQRHDSWIIETANGERHFGFDGAISIAAHSPLLRWSVPLLQPRLVRRVGERAYRFVAAHRPRTCSIAGISVPAHRPNFRLPRRVQWLVGAILILYVFSWNLAEVPAVAARIHVPDAYLRPGDVLQLGQKWDLFSPGPRSQEFSYLVTYILADGSQASTLEGGPHDRSMFASPQWNKYYIRLHALPPRYVRAYAAYMCRTWNADHPDASSAQYIEIQTEKRTTPPPGQHPLPIEREIFYRGSCSPLSRSHRMFNP